MLKIDTDAVLKKEMDRKTFLKSVGVGIIALTGVTAFVQSLNKFGAGPLASSGAIGYGDSVYGGKAIKSSKK